jgi:hypothetical protein
MPCDTDFDTTLRKNVNASFHSDGCQVATGFK